MYNVLSVLNAESLYKWLACLCWQWSVLTSFTGCLSTFKPKVWCGGGGGVGGYIVVVVGFCEIQEQPQPTSCLDTRVQDPGNSCANHWIVGQLPPGVSGFYQFGFVLQTDYWQERQKHVLSDTCWVLLELFHKYYVKSKLIQTMDWHFVHVL